MCLSEWCLQNKDLFVNKKVIELGSGVGLAGLCVALNCKPSHLSLSDCHPSVLKTLRENVNLNVSNRTEKQCLISKTSQINEESLCVTINDGSTSVIEVLDLPWEDVSEEVCEGLSVDIILAADVVFDSTLFSSFLNCVKCFMKVSYGARLLLACTERNKKTLEEFLNLLGKILYNKNVYFNAICFFVSVTFGLKHEEVPPPPQKHYYWSTDCPIRLFSVESHQ